MKAVMNLKVVFSLAYGRWQILPGLCLDHNNKYLVFKFIIHQQNLEMEKVYIVDI